jgi:hypothetical protein
MTPTASTSPRLRSRHAMLFGGLCGTLLALALGLWAAYGNAVFFEMIAAGLRTCF